MLFRSIALTSVLEQDEVTVLFHCKEGAADLPEYAGRQDLLTEAAFDGKLGPWGTAVLS